MAARELDGAPSMLPLFARAGAALIPGASHLPFVGGGGRDVPDTTLRLTDVAIDGDRLTAYDRVCAFDLRDTVPPTYPHILAFPLQLSLMTDPSFPFPAIGRSTCGLPRSRTTRAARSSRCAPRSAWVRNSCGRRYRQT
jgi:hypothetical protein